MAKLSNFKIIKVNREMGPMETISWNALAQVDVTTGIFFKKTKTREIYRKFGEDWFFTDDGAYAPMDIDGLVRAYEVKNGDIFKWLK